MISPMWTPKRWESAPLGHPVVRLVAWTGGLLAVAVGSTAVGHGALARPALTDPGSWADWAGRRTPTEAAFAVLGLGVMVLAWYLLFVSVVGGVGRLWGSVRLASVAEVLTLPAVRGLVHASLGLGLAGSAITGGGPQLGGTPGPSPSGAGPALAPGPRVVMMMAVVSAPQVEGEPPGDSSGDDPGAGPVMRRVPGGPERSDDEPPTSGGGGAVAAPGPGAAGPAEWEIQPGDHLWSVAERTLAQTWSLDPTDDEVAPYWRRLIEANRDRLADPTNPDLVLPGQVLALPPPPPSPR